MSANLLKKRYRQSTISRRSPELPLMPLKKPNFIRMKSGLVTPAIIAQEIRGLTITPQLRDGSPAFIRCIKLFIIKT